MSDTPDHVFLLAWKQQLDAGLSIAERVLESTIEICERQLEAATEAHADAEATRKAVAAARDAAEVNRLCTEWLRASVDRAARYSRAVFEIGAQSGGQIVVAPPEKPAEGAGNAEVAPPAQALLGFVDSAYKAWLEAAQQLYKLPATPPPAAKSQGRAAA